MNEGLSAILQLAEAGGTVVLLAILFKLWQAYEKQNDFIREMLKTSDTQQMILAEKAGMSLGELKAQAHAIRAMDGDAPTLPK